MLACACGGTLEQLIGILTSFDWSALAAWAGAFFRGGGE